MGKNGLRTRNYNRELLAKLCLENKLVIGETLFAPKKIHRTTWVSSDKQTQNQIGHIIISRKGMKNTTTLWSSNKNIRFINLMYNEATCRLLHIGRLGITN